MQTQNTQMMKDYFSNHAIKQADSVMNLLLSHNDEVSRERIERVSYAFELLRQNGFYLDMQHNDFLDPWESYNRFNFNEGQSETIISFIIDQVQFLKTHIGSNELDILENIISRRNSNNISYEELTKFLDN